MNYSGFKQIISPSQTINNFSNNEIKGESQNNSLLNLSERNDSRHDFLFGKGNRFEKKQDDFNNLGNNNSTIQAQDNTHMIFSKQQKIQSAKKSSLEEDCRSDQNNTNNQISQFIRCTSSNSENNTLNNHQQSKYYKKAQENKAKIGKLNQVHSVEKSPTLQSQERDQGERLQIINSGKKSSTMNTEFPKESQISMIKQFKQKYTFMSSINSHYGEKTETNTLINLKKSAFRWNIVSKFENVLSFINILKNNSTITNSYHSLNQKHHELIGDKADIKSESFRAITGKLKFLFDSTIQKIPIFSPESRKIIFWNFIVAICILIQFVVIPLKISFFIEISGVQSEIFLFYLPALIFMLEIFIRLNISFYQEGILVQSRYKIIYNYMFQTYFFWLDLITTITFLISKESNHLLLIIVVVLRVLQLIQLVNDIDEHYQITQRFSSQWNLLKLLLIILMLAHFTGCGFHYIAYIQSENGSITWLDKQKIFNEDWQIRFLYSIYWASITMITVGYGDIVPITNSEKLYVIIMTLISAGVFAYSINTIGAIFGEIQKQKVVMKQNNLF